MDVVDCQGFGGAFALGAVQAGFTLAAKLEDPSGFGIPVLRQNPHLYGKPDFVAAKPGQWPAYRDVAMLVGNPPCSGFSLINTAKGNRGRGMESHINQCMWDFWTYGADIQAPVIIMESVSQAYSQGADLMRRLVEHLRTRSGLPDYRLTHVVQDNLSVGGWTKRTRYFLVASRVPFSVAVPHPVALPTMRDAIGDLAELPLQWEAQPLRCDIPLRPEDAYRHHQFHTHSHYADGHAMHDNPHNQRMMSLVFDSLTGARKLTWQGGERDMDIIHRYWLRYASLPTEWDYLTREKDGTVLTKAEQFVKNEFQRSGFSGVVAWHPDRPGRVLTGAGPGQAFNPIAQRMLTYRECARIMGFPDSLLIGPLKGMPGLPAWWGKQTSVAPARWISEAARYSLESTGPIEAGERTYGTPDEHGDMVINVAGAWREVILRQRQAVLRAAAEAKAEEIARVPWSHL